jgi:hypothetical protein
MGDLEGRVVFLGRKRKVQRREWREEREYNFYFTFMNIIN